MNLVEAEAIGPVEGDAPQINPPRPPHRRVSVSLLFTLTVLTGTVVAIYLAFPARHNVLMTEAIAQHRDPEASWDLVAPSTDELRGWLVGVVGKVAKVPAGATIRGARRIEILRRNVAVIGMTIDASEVTFVVQRAQRITPRRTDRVDDDLHAVAWSAGPFTFVAVGPQASYVTWRAAFP